MREAPDGLPLTVDTTRRAFSGQAAAPQEVSRKLPAKDCAPPLLPRPPNCGTVKHKGPSAMSILSCERSGILSLLSCLFCLCAFPVRAQEEIVANLAAGRVVIDVARDGIVIGAVEQRIEADSRPPLIFPINDRRIAILLGAAEWTQPGTGLSPVRLDRVIPRISSEVVRAESRDNPDQAGDIESIGVAFLEKLRTMAEQLHHKIVLGPDEPLVSLVLVDYQPNYGPEVWLLEYRIQQQALRGDFYQTRTLRPSYTQLYPPEKHQLKTLVEVRYPLDASGPTVLQLLNSNDPLLAPLRHADPKIVKVIQSLEDGKSQSVPADSCVDFLRAALDPLAGPQNRLVLGVLRQERGWDWILAPPEPTEKAAEDKNRPPGAPSLRRKP